MEALFGMALYAQLWPYMQWMTVKGVEYHYEHCTADQDPSQIARCSKGNNPKTTEFNYANSEFPARHDIGSNTTVRDLPEPVPNVPAPEVCEWGEASNPDDEAQLPKKYNVLQASVLIKLKAILTQDEQGPVKQEPDGQGNVAMMKRH